MNLKYWFVSILFGIISTMGKSNNLDDRFKIIGVITSENSERNNIAVIYDVSLKKTMTLWQGSHLAKDSEAVLKEIAKDKVVINDGNTDVVLNHTASYEVSARETTIPTVDEIEDVDVVYFSDNLNSYLHSTYEPKKGQESEWSDTPKSLPKSHKNESKKKNEQTPSIGEILSRQQIIDDPANDLVGSEDNE